MDYRVLTQQEIIEILEGRGDPDLDTTCEGDQGHGPCGTWMEYYVDDNGKLRCNQDHEIEVVDGSEHNP